MKTFITAPWRALSSDNILLCLEEGTLSPPSLEDFVFVLQRFRKERDITRTSRLYAYMRRSDWEAHISSLGNHLVSMLAGVGCVHDAQRVFDQSEHRDEMSWNSLITGYANANMPHQAIALYWEMQMTDPVSINSTTYVALLKACPKQEDLETGFEVHLSAMKLGLLEFDTFLGSSLVDMYAKCGFLEEAQEVFSNLATRDVVTWTAMISGYAEHRYGPRALDCFQKMLCEGISPNAVTYVCTLKACTSEGALTTGKEIHADAERMGMLGRHCFLGSALVDMYSKCGSMTLAQKVFETIPVHDAVSWTSLITGHSDHENTENVLQSFEQMLSEGIQPSDAIFVCTTKACGNAGTIEKARIIHLMIESQGLTERNVVFGRALVGMYVKLGFMNKAQEVLEKLPVRDASCWTVLISGFSEHDDVQEVMRCFGQMYVEGSLPDASAFSCMIKACNVLGNIDRGRTIFIEANKQSLLSEDIPKCISFVKVYTRCGLLADAQHLFDEIPFRDVVLWTTLIGAYTEHSYDIVAMQGFRRMQCESICPNTFAFMHSLKSYGNTSMLHKVQELHSQIEVHELAKGDYVLSNVLIDVYSKCRQCMMAHVILEKLCVRNVISWTTLISGYVEDGYNHSALNCFEEMQFEGHCPNVITFTCCIKACGNISAMSMGQDMHSRVEMRGYVETDHHIGNALVDMYLKFGFHPEAHEVFCRLPDQDVDSWNVLITGCVENGFSENAIECLKQMQLKGISPNSFTFVSCLKACEKIGSVNDGWGFHAEIEKTGFFESDTYVGSTLVDMYAKFGLHIEAKQMFDKLSVRDVVSWTALIAGYAEQGLGEEALKCFNKMQREGFLPNPITLTNSLKACGSIKAIDEGRMVHEEIERRELMKREPAIACSVVDMYAKCGFLSLAEEVFHSLSVQDEFAWAALITGYADQGYNKKVIDCVERMQHDCILFNLTVYICSLKACGSLGDIDSGRKVHSVIERLGLMQNDICIGNALLDMYAKCGYFTEAEAVFYEFPDQDVISWNVLIAGYVNHGHNTEAMMYFNYMQSMGVCPNKITLMSMLKDCDASETGNTGQKIFADVAEKRPHDPGPFLGSAIISFLVNKGSLVLARQIFNTFPTRDAAMWTSLIAGYSQHGYNNLALDCYEQMLCEGVCPSPATFVHCLMACSQIGATNKGRSLHAEVERLGLLGHDNVGNSLINMYAKCGLLKVAQQVFDQLLVRDVVSWTALMSGCVYLGESQNSFHSFEQMLDEGIKPDQVTFVVLLNACSRTGLLFRCQMYFEAMSKLFGISPNLKHHCCVVHLLGRSGQLEKAVTSVKALPVHPNLVTWHALLSSCRKSGNANYGREVFEKTLCSKGLDDLHFHRNWELQHAERMVIV